jgi:hypothetical protein
LTDLNFTGGGFQYISLGLHTIGLIRDVCKCDPELVRATLNLVA